MLFSDPIFPVLPNVGAEAFQRLLRFLAGMEDFARVNAHHKRKTTHAKFIKRFADAPNVERKRSCMFCRCAPRDWGSSLPIGRFPPKTYFDSEWHAVFYCPFLHTARRKFKLALAASGHNITFRDNWGPARVAEEGAQELADLIIQCRLDRDLVGALAHFIGDIMMQRKDLFRRFSKDA